MASDHAGVALKRSSRLGAKIIGSAIAESVVLAWMTTGFLADEER